MVETIMPGFARFPTEGTIVGRLLAGYGELELELCKCIGAATGDLDKTIKSFFNLRGAERRIDWANKQVGGLFKSADLDAPFQAAIGDMDHCRSIRNQYAHCYWYDTSKDGLAFVDLETVAKQTTNVWPLEAHRCFIDLTVLERQEGFFKYVQKYFWYLEGEYQTRVNGQHGHVWMLPLRIQKPAKHK